MQNKYTTKRLLGSVLCAAGMALIAPAAAQDAVDQPEELFDNEPQNNNDQQVEVGDTGEIDLHVKELEITKVLQLLSIQSQRNIIASRGVENVKISADLYGVDFYEALNSILDPNGFGYIEEGNFIYVLTKAEIEERDKALRKMITRIHRLDYLRADEAAGFVTPMLSENGSITFSGNVVDGIQPTIDDAGADSYAGPPTLVIRDYEDQVAAIEGVLGELDLRPKQVIIEATILTASLSEANQFGVDFSLFTDLTGTSPLSVVDSLITGGSADSQRSGGIDSTVGNVAAQDGGVKLGFVAGDAAIFVSALDSVTDTTVISTPKTTVLDRNRADILVGEKIAYLSTTVTETSETQTVEFLEVGTQLSVRPFVSSDGNIRLELRPSVSDATIRNIGSTTAPDESTVELVTNVIVESGQTIVLGGLFTDDNSVSRSQVPFLGDIPGIGAAFQGQDDTVSRSEVIFLVKATVVESDTLIDLGNEAMARIDVARVAEREQLLPWSRSKLTSAHIVNARKYYDEAQSLTGEARDEKLADALYCIDLALHMNPSMVDALILKEQITGEASYIKYEESIVNQTYDAVLDAEMKGLGVPELPDEDAGEMGAAEEELIAPEPVAQDPAAQADPFALTEAEQQAQDQAQAQADDAWLDAMINEQLAEENAEAQASVEPEPLDPAEEGGPGFQPQPDPQPEPEQQVQVEPLSFVEPVQDQGGSRPEPAEYEDEYEASEPFEALETVEARPEQGSAPKLFGFSWRALSTAQLLQLAAEATEQAETEPVADVPTQTD